MNKKVPSDLNSLARTIKKQIAPSKLYSIIQFLFAVSASDGKISPQEESYIYNIGLQMGFKRNSLDAIKNQFVKTNNTSKKYDKKTLDSLNVLGLKGGATKEEIKIAYRNLVKEFHPDKLAGMGDGIKNLAKEKFQTIQHSYEYLNKIMSRKAKIIIFSVILLFSIYDKQILNVKNDSEEVEYVSEEYNSSNRSPISQDDIEMDNSLKI